MTSVLSPTVGAGSGSNRFDFESARNCHDTFFAQMVGVNATNVNIVNDDQGNGRHWDNFHTFNTNYPDVGGSAWYGFESFGHDYVGFPQVDNGRYGAIYIGPNGPGGSVGTRIFGTKMDCTGRGSVPAASVTVTQGSTVAGSPIVSVNNTAGFAVGDPVNAPGLQPNSVVTQINSGTITVSKPALVTSASSVNVTNSHGYQGVELFPQLVGVTIAGTFATCGSMIAASQVVTDDGLFGGIPTDPSTQLLANSTANYSTVFGTQASAPAAIQFPSGASFNMHSTDYHVCASPPSTGITVTLPPSPASGVSYSVDNCTNTTFTIKIQPSPNNGNIDNASSYSFNASYGTWTGYFTGSNWKTTAKGQSP